VGGVPHGDEFIGGLADIFIVEDDARVRSGGIDTAHDVAVQAVGYGEPPLVGSEEIRLSSQEMLDGLERLRRQPITSVIMSYDHPGS
jgi:hypothetical protein